MATTAPPDVIATINSVADLYGVPRSLAIAVAKEESGLDPRSVGDKGTSFGLYNLHKGGELGDLTPEQAFDPLTNARVALSVIGSVYHQNPGLSPGEVAAKAQRPLDPVGYAKTINELLGADPSSSSATGSNVNVVTDAAGALGGAVGGALDGLNPFNWPSKLFGLFGDSVAGKVVAPAIAVVLKGLTGIVFTIAALGLMAMGLSRLTSTNANEHFERLSQVAGAMQTAGAVAAL